MESRDRALSIRERLGVLARGVLLVALVGFVAWSMVEGQAPVETGVGAPHAHLTSYDGKSWGLDQLAGRPVLLNFWATWCGPCLAEMPELVAASKKHQRDLVVVGAVVDSPREEVFSVIRRYGIGFPVAEADAETVQLWRATTVPLTYLLDENHRVVWSARGAVDHDSLEEAIETHIGSGLQSP